MNIKAKMTCECIEEFGSPKYREQVSLRAVYANETNAEDNSFASATPNARVEMSIDNPTAFGAFETGRQYYVEFSPVPSAPADGGATKTEGDCEEQPDTIGLDFGRALKALKKGERICRSGWNGKNMWLFLLPAGTVPLRIVHDPALRAVVEANGGEIEALASIRMKTADNKILTGWLASQTDMLADDWQVLPSADGAPAI
jgi:hypothetical protein